MSELQNATGLITELVQKTREMREGVIPSVYEISGIQADLVKSYYLVGQEMCAKFSEKERAYLHRVITASDHYFKNRQSASFGAKDSEMKAKKLSHEEYKVEIEKAEEYERYKSLMKSIDHAIHHSSQVISLIKTTDSR